MKVSPTSPLFWWSGRRAGYPPVPPAATGRIQPRLSQINPLVWWAQHRGSAPGPPATSPGQLRAWVGVSLPIVVWSSYRPRGGEGSEEPPYVVGSVYPSAMAASSRFAGDGADPWASTAIVAAEIADPSAASSRKLGNRP